MNFNENFFPPKKFFILSELNFCQSSNFASFRHLQSENFHFLLCSKIFCWREKTLIWFKFEKKWPVSNFYFSLEFLQPRPISDGQQDCKVMLFFWKRRQSWKRSRRLRLRNLTLFICLWSQKAEFSVAVGVSKAKTKDIHYFL